MRCSGRSAAGRLVQSPHLRPDLPALLDRDESGDRHVTERRNDVVVEVGLVPIERASRDLGAAPSRFAPVLEHLGNAGADGRVRHRHLIETLTDNPPGGMSQSASLVLDPLNLRAQATPRRSSGHRHDEMASSFRFLLVTACPFQPVQNRQPHGACEARRRIPQYRTPPDQVAVGAPGGEVASRAPGLNIEEARKARLVRLAK